MEKIDTNNVVKLVIENNSHEEKVVQLFNSCTSLSIPNNGLPDDVSILNSYTEKDYKSLLFHLLLAKYTVHGMRFLGTNSMADYSYLIRKSGIFGSELRSRVLLSRGTEGVTIGDDIIEINLSLKPFTLDSMTAIEVKVKPNSKLVVAFYLKEKI